MHVAAHAVPQPNLLGKGCLSLSDSCDLIIDLLPGTLLIVVALYVRERESARVKAALCHPPHLGLKDRTAQKIRVQAVVGLAELAHMQRTGRFQVGQQGRNEVSERHTKVLAGGTAHLLLQVSPTRFDALGVVVARVAGRCVGVVTALAGPVPLEPRCSAVLSNGAQPVGNFVLDRSSHLLGMRIEKPCHKLRELDIVLLRDELGTERLFLLRDGC